MHHRFIRHRIFPLHPLKKLRSNLLYVVLRDLSATAGLAALRSVKQDISLRARNHYLLTCQGILQSLLKDDYQHYRSTISSLGMDHQRPVPEPSIIRRTTLKISLRAPQNRSISLLRLPRASRYIVYERMLYFLIGSYLLLVCKEAVPGKRTMETALVGSLPLYPVSSWRRMMSDGGYERYSDRGGKVSVGLGIIHPSKEKPILFALCCLSA